MKRPSFQFYPEDWLSNSNLRRCSHEEKGIWIDIICLLHDQEEYGVVRWPLAEISQAVGCSILKLRNLVNKGVLKGCDASGEVEALIYVPRSGRKDGPPVTLVEQQKGPLWYSSRMVIDEYKKENRGGETRFSSGEDNPNSISAEKNTERAKLRAKVLSKSNGLCHHCGKALNTQWEIDHLMPRSKGGRHSFDNLVASCRRCNQDKSDTMPDDWLSPTQPIGDETPPPNQRKGDGSPSPSPSPTPLSSEGKPSGGEPPKMTDPDDIIFGYGVPLLTNAGTADKQARSFLGGLRKAHGDNALIDKLRECLKAKPLQPLEWLAAALPPGAVTGAKRKPAPENFATKDYGTGGRL